MSEIGSVGLTVIGMTALIGILVCNVLSEILAELKSIHELLKPKEFKNEQTRK